MKVEDIIERVYCDLDRKVKDGKSASPEVVVRTLVAHMNAGNGWRYRQRLCEEFLPEEAACEWPWSGVLNPDLS